jgi:hypothetical protein
MQQDEYPWKSIHLNVDFKCHMINSSMVFIYNECRDICLISWTFGKSHLHVRFNVRSGRYNILIYGIFQTHANER